VDGFAQIIGTLKHTHVQNITKHWLVSNFLW